MSQLSCSQCGESMPAPSRGVDPALIAEGALRARESGIGNREPEAGSIVLGRRPRASRLMEFTAMTRATRKQPDTTTTTV